MIKISVILISYNHEKYLREAIDSVLNQTFEEFELIIWDDASVNNSWEIIQSYKDLRIKAFKNETSKRGIYGLNKTISEIAQGDYIAIHHSDDVWEPTKLEKQVAFLENYPDVGAVFTNVMAINEESQPFTDESHFYFSIFNQTNRTRYEWLNFFFYHGNALCHPSVLIRKECYEECGLYRYGLAQLGDFDMWIRLCMKYEIHVLPEKLVRFRVRDNEANSSGDTSITRIRGLNEHFFIIKSCFSTIGYDEIIKIFPDTRKHFNPNGYIPEFLLSMAALEDTSWRDIKLLGLMLLYAIVNDKQKAQEAKELYNFDYLSLVVLSAKYDVFAQEELHQLYNPAQHIQLFTNQGNGFSEENSIKLRVAQNAELQKFTFDLTDKQNIKSLRLYPLNECCVIEIESLHVKKENEIIDLMPYLQANACIQYGKAYFFTTDDSSMYFGGFGESILQKALAVVVIVRYVHRGKDALYVKIKQQEKELNAFKNNVCFKILQKVGLL